MTAIRGHWQQGQIVLDQPVAWADGAHLVIFEANDAHSKVGPEDLVFMTEEEQGDDPESIARWIARMDAIPPLEMSAEDEAAMWSWRQKMKDHNIEAMRQQFQRGEP